MLNMHLLGRFIALILGSFMLFSAVVPNALAYADDRYDLYDWQYTYKYTDGSSVEYKYSTPTNPLYKYTTPTGPYKYTTPTNPYKYTYPTGPYKYTYPAGPYKYTYPTNPYKYTRPSVPYKYTRPTNPLYKYTRPEDMYNYTEPDSNYNYTDVNNDVQYSKPYWDIEGHPAESYIIELSNLGIVQGYPDGSFRPENPVTRAEMLKMVMMASMIQPLPDHDNPNLYFVDLDGWQAEWVNTAYTLGIVDGYGSYYAPNNPVNRAEGVKLTLASFGIFPGEIPQSSFSDVHGWMVPWVEVAYGLGIIDMSPDGRFYPESAMTRGMAAMVIVKMMDRAAAMQ